MLEIHSNVWKSALAVLEAYQLLGLYYRKKTFILIPI